MFVRYVLVYYLGLWRCITISIRYEYGWYIYTMIKSCIAVSESTDDQNNKYNTQLVIEA